MTNRKMRRVRSRIPRNGNALNQNINVCEVSKERNVQQVENASEESIDTLPSFFNPMASSYVSDMAVVILATNSGLSHTTDLDELPSLLLFGGQPLIIHQMVNSLQSGFNGLFH